MKTVEKIARYVARNLIELDSNLAHDLDILFKDKDHIEKHFNDTGLTTNLAGLLASVTEFSLEIFIKTLANDKRAIINTDHFLEKVELLYTHPTTLSAHTKLMVMQAVVKEIADHYTQQNVTDNDNLLIYQFPKSE